MSPTKTTVIGDLCAALDALNKACNVRTKDSSKWCLRHDEAWANDHLFFGKLLPGLQERIKLYINYKAHHAALNAFPERTICQNVKSIMSCLSLDVVRAWNKSLISKYQLLNR